MASGKTDPNINYKDEDDESEDVNDEEALLVALEVEKEKEHAEESAHPNEQPKDVAAAPRILQDALKQGLVTASDSEEEIRKSEKIRQSRAMLRSKKNLQWPKRLCKRKRRATTNLSLMEGPISMPE